MGVSDQDRTWTEIQQMDVHCVGDQIPIEVSWPLETSSFLDPQVPCQPAEKREMETESQIPDPKATGGKWRSLGRLSQVWGHPGIARSDPSEVKRSSSDGGGSVRTDTC